MKRKEKIGKKMRKKIKKSVNRGKFDREEESEDVKRNV